jgi:hypothetical protein
MGAHELVNTHDKFHSMQQVQLHEMKSHDTTRKDSQTTRGSATSYRGNNEIETDATTDLFQLFPRTHTGLTIRFSSTT